MITDESFPTRTCGLSSWRRLETRVGWPHPFTAKGTEVQRVGRHSQGYTSKGSGWAGLHTPCSTRAQGNWAKVTFARRDGGQRGKPTREAETWLCPGPLGQTATKIPLGP